MPSRIGRGRWAAVDFVVCFGWGGRFFRVFFSEFFFLRTHTACCKFEATSCLIYLSTSNEARQDEGAKRPRPFFAFRAKRPLHDEARPRERSDRSSFLPLGQKSLFIMIMRQVRGSEATEAVFFPLGKKASSHRGAYRVPLFS